MISINKTMSYEEFTEILSRIKDCIEFVQFRIDKDKRYGNLTSILYNIKKALEELKSIDIEKVNERLDFCDEYKYRDD